MCFRQLIGITHSLLKQTFFCTSMKGGDFSDKKARHAKDLNIFK